MNRCSGTRSGTRRILAAVLTLVIVAGVAAVTTLTSLAEGGSWLDTTGTADVETLPDDNETSDSTKVTALYRTNILAAEDGVGTSRYTLALSTDAPIDEEDPTLAAMAILTRRIIALDGSLGDPADASPLSDVDATLDIGAVDTYAVLSDKRSLFIYKNGEQVVSEQTHDKYTTITYTRDLKKRPGVRYTRSDGKTLLYPFTTGCVVLFSGEFINLTIDYAMNGSPVALGSGCRIETLHVNSRILMHNSGLVEDSDYPPDGIDMLGIALDEEQKPILIDSGMWSTGPRRVRGRLCKVCKTEYNSKIEAQYELHLIHVCEWEDCKYGGQWASCAKEGSPYDPALHGPAPWCPYKLCATCSDIRCSFCQADIAAGRQQARVK